MSPANYFDTAYRDYESQNPPAKLDHYLDVIVTRSPTVEPSLLDVGCGRGAFLERASSRFPAWDLFGTDIDAEGVSTTEVRVPGATIRRGDAGDIPFPPESFDVIAAWDVLEHVSDLDVALSEIRRCLKPAGLLTIVVPVYDGVTGPLVRLLDRDPTHIHKMSRDLWVSIINEHFDDLEWHGIHRYLLTRALYLHRPTRRMRRAAGAILISALRRP